ncbi:MAG: tRNA pseudouridine(38-40) synthase TruA [Desulfobulbaceae bacterium DB1]|nr:MAG: tRNA pseudouridine(38-40) synthase TruA [Desulfobulbaceae bacterium DB1]
MGVHSVHCRNIKLTVAFDGTDYAGWQRQNNAPTVQAALEKKLAVMTGENIVVHGAGRTDAGVHALGMTAHFKTSSAITCHAFQQGLNSLLAASIKILRVEDVSEDFHSRISAKAKIYQYFFSTGSLILPHRRLYCAHLPGPFDLDRACRCLPFIRGSKDFSSFEAVGSRDRAKVGGRGATRHIFSATLQINESCMDEYVFEICGDGFLRKMVRNIIGSVIEVGRNRMEVEDFVRLFELRDRAMAAPTAPACGLFLKNVFYDDAGIRHGF